MRRHSPPSRVAAFSSKPCAAAFSSTACVAAFFFEGVGGGILPRAVCGGILLGDVYGGIILRGVWRHSPRSRVCVSTFSLRACGGILLKSVCGASFVANTNEPLLKAGLTKGKPIPTEGQTPPANAKGLPPPRAPCPAYSILRRFKFCAGLRNLHASFCSTSKRRCLLLDTSGFCG